MAKKILKIAKLQFIGNEARPGPSLASVGINIGAFCNQFNEKTKNRKGDVVPVVITVYKDKTFKFITKTTPTSVLIKKHAQIEKGASNSIKEKVATLTHQQIEEIAKYKLVDLNTNSIKKAILIVKGTMKQMGVTEKNKTTNEEK